MRFCDHASLAVAALLAAAMPRRWRLFACGAAMVYLELCWDRQSRASTAASTVQRQGIAARSSIPTCARDPVGPTAIAVAFRWRAYPQQVTLDCASSEQNERGRLRRRVLRRPMSTAKHGDRETLRVPR